jgi:molybdenum cofactor synthesis domain-containing protein
VEASDRQSTTVTKVHVITVSDGVFNGKRADSSGQALLALLSSGHEVSGPEVVPDEVPSIIEAIETAIARGIDVVVTTGGTGLGPRDVTPQATSELIEYEVPGIAEEMRRVGRATTPMAALSRGMAGVRGRTLIINVPGSVKGATESLEAVMPILGHAVQLLHGDTEHLMLT